MRGVLVVLAVLLAGCGQSAAPDDVVIVESTDDVEVESDGTPAVRTGDGLLSGVVVDEALHTVAGAVVRLPGMDQEKSTDEEGRFAFNGLWPGPYLLEADAKGFDPVEAVVEVKDDATTQVRVELIRRPSEDPYHQTLKFEGYAELASSWTFGLTGLDCSPCVFRAMLPDVAEDLIVEATRGSGNTGSPGATGFDVYIRDDGGRMLASSYEDDPAHVRVPGADLDNATTLYVEARPSAFLVPDVGISFEVFVTSFHNGRAPEAWSVMGGDA